MKPSTIIIAYTRKFSLSFFYKSCLLWDTWERRRERERDCKIEIQNTIWCPRFSFSLMGLLLFETHHVADRHRSPISPYDILSSISSFAWATTNFEIQSFSLNVSYHCRQCAVRRVSQSYSYSHTNIYHIMWCVARYSFFFVCLSYNDVQIFLVTSFYFLLLLLFLFSLHYTCMLLFLGFLAPVMRFMLLPLRRFYNKIQQRHRHWMSRTKESKWKDRRSCRKSYII